MSEEQKEPTPAETKPKLIKVSPARWAEIENAWAQAKYATIDDLAEEVKISVPQLRERFKWRKVYKGQAIEAYNKKVQEELDKKAVASAKVLAQRIDETREQHYTMANGIAKLTWEAVAKARQDGVAFASIKQNLSSLESAMKVLKMAREERFAVLGLDNGNVGDEDEGLPELVVNELSQDQIEEMRARDAVLENDDDDIVSVTADIADPGEIDGELEE